MNMNIRKLFIIAAILFAVFCLADCSDFIRPGNGEYGGVYAGDTMGLVKICMSGDPLYATPRTLMPVTANPGRYVFKFTNLAAGKTVNKELSIPGSNVLELPLSSGDWTVEVKRYETRSLSEYLVASGTASIIGLMAGDTPTVTVSMTPVDGDTGFFTYSINLPLAGAKADLRVVKVSNGAQYGFSDAALPKSGTINLPPGDYDVFVSVTAPDGRGSGKYSAARIYSGMVTSTIDNSTELEFFTFTPEHFVQSLNLEGHVNFDLSCGIKPDTSLSSNISVQAYDALTNSPVLTSGGAPADPSLVKWNGTNPSAEWQILNIAPDKRSVYFVISVEGDDGKTYKTTKPLITVSPAPPTKVLSNIPDNGKDGITLSTGIYAVNTSGSWTPGNITPKVDGIARGTASPGEVVILDILSDYGLKAGSLKVVKGAELIDVSGSDSSYNFIMPDGNVSLDAVFYSAKLSSLSLYSSQISVSFAQPFNPDTSINNTYTASVPYVISTIEILGSAEENGMVVTGIGTKALSSTINYFQVNVAPPLGSGPTRYASRNYYIQITRRGMDTLTDLSLTDLALNNVALDPNFAPDKTLYSAAVSESSLIITPTPSLGATWEITGPYDNLQPGFNTICINVTPQYGGPEHKNSYTIMVYYSP